MPDRQETGATPPADYTIALEQTLENVPPLPGEVVDHGRAEGRVLRAPILADRDLPPCDRSRMDGYALRAADLHPNATMPVAGEIPAGSDGTLEVPAGSVGDKAFVVSYDLDVERKEGVRMTPLPD